VRKAPGRKRRSPTISSLAVVAGKEDRARLAAWRGMEGAERTMTAAQNATAEAAGLLPWRHNGLRHAFCSYRVAATQDVPAALWRPGIRSVRSCHYRAPRHGGGGHGVVPPS